RQRKTIVRCSSTSCCPRYSRSGLREGEVLVSQFSKIMPPHPPTQYRFNRLPVLCCSRSTRPRRNSEISAIKQPRYELFRPRYVSRHTSSSTRPFSTQSRRVGKGNN
ncbi:hypothetical protein JG687_00015686, partial [Phytophthora cactorum]